MTSCHVSEQPKKGPEASQTMMVPHANRNPHVLPVQQVAKRANFSAHDLFMTEAHYCKRRASQLHKSPENETSLRARARRLGELSPFIDRRLILTRASSLRRTNV